MSSYIRVNNDPESQTVNWMLEGFSAELKQKCKEHAVLQRQTLKAFVETTLRQAVGMAAVPEKSEVKRETPEEDSPTRGLKPATRSRNKGQRSCQTKFRAS